MVEWEGHKEVVEVLLDNGPNGDTKDKSGVTALHAAAERGHREVMKLLIDKLTAINRPDERKRTALHLAAERGYKTWRGCCSRMRASNERKAVLTLFLEKGASIDAKDQYERT